MLLNLGTNINKALEKGIEFLNKRAAIDSSNPSIIVFLTDGRPSDGERNVTNILDGVKKNNTRKIEIYTLGFGSQVSVVHHLANCPFTYHFLEHKFHQ